MHRHLLLLSLALSGWAVAQPRNIILMISDGGGYNQIAAANFHQTGQAQAQAYESFPVVLPMSTHSATGNPYNGQEAAQDASWVKLKPTDSAASGTALATGVKTYDAAIGVDADKKPLENLSQRARRLGKSSGVVTSVPLSHATPAAFVAHNETRQDYAGIARSMIHHSSADVIIGAGHPMYNNDGQNADTADFRYVGGEQTWNDLQAGRAANQEGPWTLVERKGTFDSLAAGLLPVPQRLIGIPQVRETLQQKRSGGKAASDSVGQVPFNTHVPSLATLAQVALRVLERDSAGFFLMIEGGAVDWAGHENALARLVEEQSEFNAAVTTVIRWIETHGGWERNLLVVTADHETGYLTGPGGVQGKKVDYPLISQGKGHLPRHQWNSGNHTNQLVPLFAKGSGSERLRSAIAGTDPRRGRYTDNALVGRVLLQLVQADAAEK